MKIHDHDKSIKWCKCKGIIPLRSRPTSVHLNIRAEPTFAVLVWTVPPIYNCYSGRTVWSSCCQTNLSCELLYCGYWDECLISILIVILKINFYIPYGNFTLNQQIFCFLFNFLILYTPLPPPHLKTFIEYNRKKRINIDPQIQSVHSG